MHRTLRQLVGPLLIVSLLLGPTAAWAQDEGVSNPADRTPAGGRRVRDAASNRNLLWPNAETVPEGDFEINDYELILLTLAYGVTDALQLSLTFAPPLVEDQPFFFWFTGKYAFVRSDTVVFSGLLSFNHFSDSGGSGESAQLITLGTLVDIIFGHDGLTALTFGLTGSFLANVSGTEDEDEFYDNSALLISSALTHEVASFVKLMLELTLPAAITDDGFEVAEGFLVGYGVRFFSDVIAGDIAFVKPIGVEDDPFILGLPFVAFSVRF